MKDNTFDKPCAICRETSPESFKIWFDGYVKLFKCKKCGFISQFPGPGKSTIVTSYEDRYTLDFTKTGQDFMYPERRRILLDNIYHISKHVTSGDILDVGCGDGHFLYLCSKKGFTCYGVEHSIQLSTYVSSKASARIVQGLYIKKMFPKNSFDIISFIQVLEHIPTPIDALETAKYHLRQNGILVIEVPSVNSPHFLTYKATRIKWFVRPPNGVITSHFGYFSPKTLLALTKKCGFKKLSLITGRWRYKYSGLLGNASKILDPILDTTKIGGILYIGQKTS